VHNFFILEILWLYIRIEFNFRYSLHWKVFFDFGARDLQKESSRPSPGNNLARIFVTENIDTIMLADDRRHYRADSLHDEMVELYRCLPFFLDAALPVILIRKIGCWTHKS